MLDQFDRPADPTEADTLVASGAHSLHNAAERQARRDPADAAGRPADSQSSSAASSGQTGPQSRLPEEYVLQLRRLGVRVTPQRLLVLEALAASGRHMTADALLQWAAQRYPALNLATVYRTLDLLVEHGLVAQTDLGSGVSYFELVGESPHHHLVCERCGAVSDLDAALLAPLQQRLLDTYGFQANLRHVALFGACKACQAAGDAEPGAHSLP